MVHDWIHFTFGSTVGLIISAARKVRAFKFYTVLGTDEEHNKTCTHAECPLSGRGQGHVTKILILHPVLISGTVNGRPFKFFTELRRETYNIYICRNLGIVEWSNFALCLRVLQTHVT